MGRRFLAGQAKTKNGDRGASRGGARRPGTIAWGLRASAGVLPHRGERRNGANIPARCRRSNQPRPESLPREATHQGVCGNRVSVGNGHLGVGAAGGGHGVVEEEVGNGIGDVGAKGARGGVVG